MRATSPASSRRLPIQAVDFVLEETLLELAFLQAREQTIEVAEHADIDDEVDRDTERRCREDFTYFLQFWQFVNRETGKVQRFGHWSNAEDRFVFDWSGQSELAEHMQRDQWLMALKAGKLGFTELECAYDAWVARFRHPNARVHLFSRVEDSAKELLGIVRAGLRRLPGWMRWPVLDGPGGNTARSIKLANPVDPDDVRTIVSFPTKGNVAIEHTASHIHLDEFAHMENPEAVWASVSTTVPDGGTLHIVSRGAGDNYMRELWNEAAMGHGLLRTYFAAWDKRPRPPGWYEQGLATRSLVAQQHYAAATVDDAFAEDMTGAYIPPEIWAQRAQAFEPIGPREACVLAVDAGVSSDNFGIVAATRHPERHDEPAIRWVYLLKPTQGQHVQFQLADEVIRKFIAEHNVISLVYDPYQLEGMSQAWKRDHLTYVRAFDQGKERVQADAAMYQRAMNATMSHNGDPSLAEHIANAVTKLQKDEDSKMRIVKRNPNAKVDLAVCGSMACWEAMRLYL